MKKTLFALVGLPMLLVILFAACTDPLTGISSGTSRARVAEMPVVDLSLLPDEFIFYSNQPIGLLTLPLSSIQASTGTLSFRWLVSEFANGANAVEVVDETNAAHRTAYGTGGNNNAFFLSLAPGAIPDYTANVGTKYYSLRITNTQPAPNADYAPAVYETPFVKVTIKPFWDNSRINSVNANGVPYTTRSTELYINFDDDPADVPSVKKENITIYGAAQMGDGEIVPSVSGRQITVPLKNVTRGNILLAVKGVTGIEESFYTTSVFDDTPLTYSVLGYKKPRLDKLDVGTNRLKLEFNLPVDLTHIEILLVGGISHSVPQVPLLRNNGGKTWIVTVDTLSVAEGYTAPTIQLEPTVGVLNDEALIKSITGAEAKPKVIEW